MKLEMITMRTKKRTSKTHHPCPKCGSSDALVYYETGPYCFSCGHKFFTSKQQEEEIEQVKTPDTYRGISSKTLDFFGVVFTKDSSYWPYGETWNERSHEGKRFSYHKEEGQEFKPFGIDKFGQGSAKAITICESAIDAASVYEMAGNFPVVGCRSASSAKSEIAPHLKYFNSFEKIYLCFDNDDPGREACAKVAALFDSKKVFIVELSRHKDANDYLVNGDVKEFKNVWWAAKKHLPKGILSGQDVPGILSKEDAKAIASYPFSKMEDMTYGIRSKELILVTALEKMGKLLDLRTKLPTPTGWTTVGDLKVGDELISSRGTACKVIYITPEHVRPTFKLTFSDKTTVVAGDNHRWTVRNLNNKVFVTDTISMYNEGLVHKGSKAKFMVPMMEPLELEEKKLPIDPFILGVWLADGNSHNSYITLSQKKLDKISNYTKEYCEKEKDKGDCYRVRVSELTSSALKENNLYKNKHIPSIYLRSSLKQRTSLFKGLCFDGWTTQVNGKQENEFYSSNETLFNQVVELARSLGYLVTCSSRKGRYKNKDGDFVNCKQAFKFRYRMVKWKAIRSIKPIEPVPAKCLTVDHPDHLFACGEGWNLTHNTEFFRAIEYHLLKTTNHNIGIIHLEEGVKRAIQGFVSYELGKPVHLPTANVSTDMQIETYKQLDPDGVRISYYPHFGTDDPDIILQVIRYLVTGLDCKFIFLDHLTMLVTGAEGDDERKKLDYLATQLAMLTRELDFTLFLISHVNDEGQTRGSRLIGKTCDLRINISRDKVNPNEVVRNTTKVVISDNRFSGMTGPCDDLYFDRETGKLGEAQSAAPF